MQARESKAEVDRRVSRFVLPEIDRKIELAPFPLVVLRVLDLYGRSDAGPNELVEVVATDAALSSRILSLVNSSLYGFRRSIDSLPEAGVALGLRKLIEVAMLSAVSLYHSPKGHLTPRSSRLLWKRSLATGIAAKNLALRSAGRIDPERAFLAGIFAPLGLLWLYQVYPEGVQLFIRWLHRQGSPGLEAERRVLGFDHFEKAAELLANWRLPTWIAPTLLAAREDASEDPLAGAVSAGERLAMAMLLEEGELVPEDEWTYDRLAVERLLAEAPVDPVRMALRARVHELFATL